MKPARLPRAFTLIELLVVISIVALLLAILMPSLKQARASSRSLLCLNNQRQIFIFMQFYTADSNDKVPYHSTSGGQHYTSWFRVVNRGYIPQIDTVASGGGLVLASNVKSDPRLCSELPRNVIVGNNVHAFGYSHYMMPMEISGYRDSAGVWSMNRYPLRLDGIIKPTGTTAFCDSWWDPGTNRLDNLFQSLGEGQDPYYRSTPGLNELKSRTDGGYPPAATATWRHLKFNSNFVFFDGHAETRKRDTADKYTRAGYHTTVNRSGGFGYLLGPLRGLPYDESPIPF